MLPIYGRINNFSNLCVNYPSNITMFQNKVYDSFFKLSGIFWLILSLKIRTNREVLTKLRPVKFRQNRQVINENYLKMCFMTKVNQIYWKSAITINILNESKLIGLLIK